MIAMQVFLKGLTTTFLTAFISRQCFKFCEKQMHDLAVPHLNSRPLKYGVNQKVCHSN